jgi:hypothetical protein
MAKSLLTVKVKKRKTILPRGADAKHLGEEPSWEDLGFLNESEQREKEMTALNWYNYFYEPKEGRKFILEFMEAVNMPRVTVVMFNRLPDAQINSTTAAMSRMYVMGWEDSEKRKKIESRIMDLCRKGANLISEDRKQAATKANVPQKINTNELITDIEQMIDEDSETLSGFYEWLKNRNAKPTDVRGVMDYYGPWLQELIEAADRTADPQLKEGYAYLGKKGLKERTQLFQSIISDCESFLSNSRKSVVRKPRKTKPKTADKVVSKMKFQKEHDELKIVSIDPTKIVGARELWTFNTKYNVLAHYWSEHGMSVKGTTLQGIDDGRSKQKKLRKPIDTLPLITGSTAKAAERAFENLKTKEASTNGRINEFTVILRAVK